MEMATYGEFSLKFYLSVVTLTKRSSLHAKTVWLLQLLAKILLTAVSSFYMFTLPNSYEDSWSYAINFIGERVTKANKKLVRCIEVTVLGNSDQLRAIKNLGHCISHLGYILRHLYPMHHRHCIM